MFNSKQWKLLVRSDLLTDQRIIWHFIAVCMWKFPGKNSTPKFVLCDSSMFSIHTQGTRTFPGKLKESNFLASWHGNTERKYIYRLADFPTDPGGICKRSLFLPAFLDQPRKREGDSQRMSTLKLSLMNSVKKCSNNAILIINLNLLLWFWHMLSYIPMIHRHSNCNTYCLYIAIEKLLWQFAIMVDQDIIKNKK